MQVSLRKHSAAERTEISNYRGLNNKDIEIVYIKKSSEAASSTPQWISRLLPSFRFVPFSVLAFVLRHIALWLQDGFLSSCHHIFSLPPLSAGGKGGGGSRCVKCIPPIFISLHQEDHLSQSSLMSQCSEEVTLQQTNGEWQWEMEFHDWFRPGFTL